VKGLYIHLPFCKSKCGYCGFYSEVNSYDFQEAYFKALIEDLRSRENKTYETLYIGGGTPSSVNPKLLAGFIDIISVYTRGHFSESTIEANPESISDEFLTLVADYKFSRISVGCQSTSDEVLKILNRIHTSQDVFKTVEKIRAKCKDTALNLDMIFDIPDVPVETTYDTIKDIVRLDPEHISAYSYSFDTDHIKKTDSNDTDFMIVREYLTEAKYDKYEISNFAKKGYESKHNINYWLLGEYDGIGASAWSLQNHPDKRILKGKTDNLKAYIENPTAYQETETTEHPMTALEDLVFGLRITSGVDFGKICNNLDAVTKDKLYNALKVLTEKELLVWNGSVVALNKSGELLLDSVQGFLWEQLP